MKLIISTYRIKFSIDPQNYNLSDSLLLITLWAIHVRREMTRNGEPCQGIDHKTLCQSVHLEKSLPILYKLFQSNRESLQRKTRQLNETHRGK